MKPSFLPPYINDSAYGNGQRIGLLGGSFNPPHEGHVHISRIALEMLELDAVWWLVSPQNPLKAVGELAPYEERFALCQDMTAADPRMIVTDMEQKMGVNRSYDSLRKIRAHFPRTDFVWIMGMDNALSFHKWYRWLDILKLVPTAHIARPPFGDLTKNCPLRRLRAQKQIFIEKSEAFPLNPGVTYWIMQKKLVDLSSTEIRAYSNDYK